MTLQLKKYSPESNYLKVLLYGDSGTWKTVFWARAKNSLILCVENWLGWINKAFEKMWLWEPDFQLCEINKFDQLREAYELLVNWTWKFDTVVIDSISKMDNFLQAEIRGKREMMTQQEWWIFWKRMQWLIDAFMKLPMNIIIIAEEDSERDTDSVIKIYPKVSGQTWKRLSYNFDIVWHTYKMINEENKIEYKINVEYDPLAITKCRWWFITNDTPCDFNEWIKLSRSGNSEINQKAEKQEVKEYTVNDFNTLFKKTMLWEDYELNAKKIYDQLIELKWKELISKAESLKLDIDQAPVDYIDAWAKEEFKWFIDMIVRACK